MQKANRNRLSGTNKIVSCKYDISHLFRLVSFFVSKQERGRLKHDVPGKARFHLAAGVFPIRYRKADVDGLVSSDGDKSRGWKMSVHIFYLRIFYVKEIGKMRNNTSKKKQNNFSSFCKRILISSFAGAVYAMSQVTVTVFAAGGDTSTVTKPLDNLKTLVIAVIGAVGVIILAKNVMEFAQAYQQQDSSTMNSALKGIVAGAMMAGISSVLTFLGF